MKLEYAKLLSTLGFNFNMRRYNEEQEEEEYLTVLAPLPADLKKLHVATLKVLLKESGLPVSVGRCRLPLLNPR